MREWLDTIDYYKFSLITIIGLTITIIIYYKGKK